MTNSQTIQLAYGRSTINLCLPASSDVHVIRKPPMPVLADPAAAIEQSLLNPVPGGPQESSAPLHQLAKGASSACIAICDITRPVPNHLFLRPLIESLQQAGVPTEGITVLVATGLHRPNLGEELSELIGDPWVMENVRVINHDALADADHVDLGATRTRGTPVKIDRCFVEADIRIATGLVEPHFMAGYSGGRKVIAPGLAHADTIRTFHNHAFMSNPAAANCNLVGNPLHEEQLEILRLLGGAYALNTVIDENRRLSLVNFGEITASHSLAIEFIERYCRVQVDKRFSTVITSAAGYPLDKTYYQTVKGMVGAIGILGPGGNLFIASECGEGIGSKEYVSAQTKLTRDGAEGFLHALEGKPLAEIDEWQTQMQTKAMAAGQITLYSTLDQPDRALTGVRCIDSIDAFEAAIIDAIALAPSRSVAVIPEGPYVIPEAVEPISSARTAED